MASHDEKPIILLIDGECVLCHAVTRFVVKRDPVGRFRFTSLQSPAGQRLLLQGNLPTADWDTFVMVQDGRYWTRSEAALRAFRYLNGLWPLMYVLIAVPAFIRDRVYTLIARRRYRWFGRRETCLLPAANIRARFLEESGEGQSDAKQTDFC